MERCAPIRGACAVVVFASSACGFSVSGSAPSDGALDDDASADANADASTDGGVDAAIDAPLDSPPMSLFCDPSDASLIGCWEFEGTSANASATALTMTDSQLTYVVGKVGMAVRFGNSSSLAAAETTALATSSYTIEAWVRVPALPVAGERMGVLDNDGEYGLFVHDTSVRCAGLTANVTVPTNTWTHLACTLDAGSTTMRLYVDGVERGTLTATVGVAATPGLVIGANSGGGSPSKLLGDLDQLRLFGAARTAAQVCEAAGKTACP